MKFDDLSLIFETTENRVILDALTVFLSTVTKSVGVKLLKCKASNDSTGSTVYNFWLDKALPDVNVRALTGAIREYFDNSMARVKQDPGESGTTQVVIDLH